MKKRFPEDIVLAMNVSITVVCFKDTSGNLKNQKIDFKNIIFRLEEIFKDELIKNLVYVNGIGDIL